MRWSTVHVGMVNEQARNHTSKSWTDESVVNKWCPCVAHPSSNTSNIHVVPIKLVLCFIPLWSEIEHVQCVCKKASLSNSWTNQGSMCYHSSGNADRAWKSWFWSLFFQMSARGFFCHTMWSQRTSTCTCNAKGNNIFTNRLNAMANGQVSYMKTVCVCVENECMKVTSKSSKDDV